MLVGSPSSVLSRGIGTWGNVNLMVTRGFGVGTAVPDHPIMTIPATGITVRDILATGITVMSIPAVGGSTELCD